METQTPEQRHKNALLSEVRHLANMHTCPSYISVEDLQDIINVLKDLREEEHAEHNVPS